MQRLYHVAAFKAALFHILIFLGCTLSFLCTFVMLHFSRLYHPLAVFSESIYNPVLFCVQIKETGHRNIDLSTLSRLTYNFSIHAISQKLILLRQH